ncbi:MULTISPECIES: DNA polymerase Y family protein [Eggerthella]|uniref:DNA polymerase IV n=1 Tax=Eggerthella lenta TaxID=84112 RepID=A0A369MC16_EGGLN|nr:MULTISPECIES: DNA polymerase IV [Eggerthella]EFV31835.1 impB/mucB/samB family protein [Eggerthella sp. 1_3_56FAA]MDU2822792.1 DNA polymerase IV [Eggerthella lenta]RDB68047.1 DNA polymerase IV [Eggerthella lenta]RDC25282.1 DNA polymerase IV [Eggerthella lenta]
MPDRDVLHSDINCCYAQIECQARPELRGKPVVVGGDEEARHGIVLAKNLIAKRAGVKTAMALWEARKACPGLVVVPPDYRLYMDVSRRAREIYYDYTDRVEPFGPDEAWLDVTGTRRCLGLSPAEIAREVSERMVAELGISVSVGVSWNKIFAKFGSDYKKPDAVTVITRENYREVVWQAPVRDLLYVGPATERKLHSSGIDTIGQLACASDELLRNRLGKMGFVLRGFARGQDATEVKPYDRDAADVMREIKSYGNGLTAPRDICDPQSAKAYVWMLAESVAQRMREGRARARTVSVGARAADDLCTRSRQRKLPVATDVTLEVARAAWGLLRELEPLDASHPLRGIHVRASDLEPADADLQASLFDPMPRRTEMRELDASVDDLRRRYGNKCVVWGAQLVDEGAAGVDAKADNTVHPVSFFHS